jgi:ribosomal protein S18 acetylase RimI-like enzyme
MSALTIRPLHPNDFQSWLPLWDENNLGHRDEKITSTTWSRLMDDACPVHGLCAVKNGEIAGILHYVLHYTTGSVLQACYMQDVFTAAEYRGQGIAKAMIAELAEIGKVQGWSRLYWLADKRNDAAQALYRHIGVKLDFSLHILPLQD